MATGFYDTYLPESSAMQRRRNFSGDWRSRARLAVSGYNEDGSSNFWGEAKGVVLPTALGIVGGIYGGPAGAKAGSAVGQLASRGLSSMGGNVFEGTDTYDTYLSETQDNALQDSIGGMIGNLAGDAASGVKEEGSLGEYFSSLFQRNGSTPQQDSTMRRAGNALRRNRRRAFNNQTPIEGFNTSVSDIDAALGYRTYGILG